MSDGPIIQVKDVVIRNDRGTLLEDITFDIARGEIVVLLGASGCGKSTLMKHMIGLYVPDGGDVLIDGESIARADEATRHDLARKFGVLYQSGALLGSMSLLENVRLPFEEHTDLPLALQNGLARARLATVGLSGFEHYLPAKLSGGMKKRGGLARALALEPPLLFLDEPSAGLDPISSAALDELILELRDTYGITMLVVTHELDSIFTVADRAIILQDKRIAADGPVAEVAATEGNDWIRSFFTRSGHRRPV